jgi:membrane glycosyltransferase
MGPQMVVGLIFTAALTLRPDLAVCFAPIVLPLLFAAPLTVLTSRLSLGERLARAGLLATPDDRGLTATPVVFRPSPRPAQAPQAAST